MTTSTLQHHRQKKILSDYELYKKLSDDKNEKILILINFKNFTEINNLFGFESGDRVISLIGKYLLKEHSDHYDIYRTNSGYVLLSNANDFLIEVFLQKIANESKIQNHLNLNYIILKNLKISIAKSASKDIYEHAKEALHNNTTKTICYAKANNKHTIPNKKTISMLFTIKDAINENHKREICPYYQPIINNNTNEIEKLEVLIRIKDKDKFLAPSEFIPVSKKIKIYNLLTIKVIQKALKDLKDYNIKLAFNISYSDISNEQIKNKIFEILEKNNAYEKIVFEIVEDEKIEDEKIVKEFISTIKNRGGEVSIDDFGSGYANFKQIVDFNIDYVKIDGNLIKNIENKKNLSIVKMIVKHAKEFNIKVVAEYIENEKLFKIVKDLEIDCSQGYHLYKPMDKSSVIKLINYKNSK